MFNHIFEWQEWIMYKVLWNHLDQNLKKGPCASCFFLHFLTAGWSVAGILAGLLVCLELQTELMVKLTVILCAGGYAGLIPGFFGGIFYLYRMDLRKPSADPAADLAAEAEKASADPASLIYFHNN